MRYLMIIKRLFAAIPRFFLYWNEFDAHVAAWMCWVYVLPSQKGKRYFSALQRFFMKELCDLVDQYQHTPNTCNNSPRKTIWCCWLTGEASMPEIVRVCYHSMRKHAPSGVRVELITEKNYSQYISVPEYIISKYKNHIISPAHFSDVLRFCLLSKYGGMWLDATVFTSGPIPDSLFETIYYTQKVSNPDDYPKEPSRAQWCGFIWSGAPGNPLFSFIRDGLFQYWKNHNTVIDYIFFDYIILTAYHTLPYIREMMDSVHPNNEFIWSLWQMIDDVYDADKCNELFCRNIFHKLSYKRDLQKCTQTNELTTYGWILGENR